jgi:ATP-binding protein involved in chromosome partitioning
MRAPVPGVANVLAVASGKGGVGKSTTAVNLAVAMSQEGARIGLMDADIYGPNVHVMMAARERPDGNPEGQLIPMERYGVKLMSLGMIAEEGVPVIWRGPLLSKMVTQFLMDVAWAPLDVLLVDLPPGTGDVQLTLTQSAPLSGAVIVTTPQALVLEDVRRGVEMFRTVDVPVLGVVENMSTYTCRKCGTQTDVFGQGGGMETAERYGVPYLGGLPLDLEVRSGGDSGAPVAAARPESEIAEIYRNVARQLLAGMEVAAEA